MISMKNLPVTFPHFWHDGKKNIPICPSLSANPLQGKINPRREK
jgi:hypothetical protein